MESLAKVNFLNLKTDQLSVFVSCPSARQVLQVGEPGRQIPTEGNPPAVLAPQRTASSICGSKYPKIGFLQDIYSSDLIEQIAKLLGHCYQLVTLLPQM
ncbi:MAG: hypothetical protein HC862_10600 [Scytonema sp. RU_4_4]|nr:hypothetical protein [Scytonema sp. RU_4_4]